MDIEKQFSGKIIRGPILPFTAAMVADVTPLCAAEETPGSSRGFQGLIGCSPALRNVLEKVRTVAATHSRVLILGETGTGKELVANAIHNLSERKHRNFVKLSCAAMPAGLLESELFGHERGAFTGAITRRTGRFELADKGTLFLDEVGDIPLELQAKLLRVLQEQEFERLGSTQTQRVNVRLVAATNRDLASLVSQKQFRSDLFYRLNVFPIFLPPLRARREDIPLLVKHFVCTFADYMNKRITEIPPKAMDALERYPWPGNIRELQNFIERSVILTSGTVLRPPLSELGNATEVESSGEVTLEEAQRDHIRKALERTNWVVAGPRGAATRLGMKRSTLQYRIRKLGISRPVMGKLGRGMLVTACVNPTAKKLAAC
jgi:formate hydrogenlyase transcriptional activator